MPTEIGKDDTYYGPVVVTRGQFKGRIGDVDDYEGKATAIVYFGHPLMAGGYYLIRKRHLALPTVDDLLIRREAIWRVINPFVENDVSCGEKFDLLVEQQYIFEELSERFIDGEFKRTTEKGIKTFICHASPDKWFARK